jgi:hypothetical protein
MNSVGTAMDFDVDIGNALVDALAEEAFMVAAEGQHQLSQYVARVLFEHTMLSSICICITSQNVIFTELDEFLRRVRY